MASWSLCAGSARLMPSTLKSAFLAIDKGRSADLNLTEFRRPSHETLDHSPVGGLRPFRPAASPHLNLTMQPLLLLLTLTVAVATPGSDEASTSYGPPRGRSRAPIPAPSASPDTHGYSLDVEIGSNRARDSADEHSDFELLPGRTRSAEAPVFKSIIPPDWRNYSLAMLYSLFLVTYMIIAGIGFSQKLRRCLPSLFWWCGLAEGLLSLPLHLITVDTAGSLRSQFWYRIVQALLPVGLGVSQFLFAYGTCGLIKWISLSMAIAFSLLSIFVFVRFFRFLQH